MTIPLDAPEVLDREFLLVRAKLLEIAATLDRMDRADGTAADDPRMQRIRQALGILQADESERAEKIQMLFSLNYDQRWREYFNLPDSE